MKLRLQILDGLFGAREMPFGVFPSGGLGADSLPRQTLRVIHRRRAWS
jgi:hypothetical protein